MDIDKFKAIGYHGTTKENAYYFEKNCINCGYKKDEDVFLGGGFYLWRDSFWRAYRWSDRHANNNDNSVLMVEVECLNDEMLNFTTTATGKDNKELKFLKLYIKMIQYLQSKNIPGIYFGIFIDFLINKGVTIKLVTVHDLTHQLKTFKIQDPNYIENRTYFAIGDIQMCVKDHTIMIDKKVIDCENY